MKTKKSIWVVLSAFLLAVWFACSVPVSAETAEKVPKKAQVVAENSDVIMYYEEEEALVTLEYKASGKIVNTKVMDGKSGNKSTKNYQKSEFLVEYFKDNKAASTTVVENYTMSTELGHVAWEKIENGIKIVFTLREDKLSMDMLPKYIPQEKMETIILDVLTSKERKDLLEYYRLFEGYYVRTKDSGVTQSAIKKLREMIFEKTQYTEDDMEADNAEKGYVSEWNNLDVSLSMEYVLDGKDLLVRIPVDEYKCANEEVILSGFSVLPYFLSATTEENGYFVVPDGSGAVIEFNSEKRSAVDYTSRVFGKDILIDADTFDKTEYYANMPILGMVYDDYAYLAIVEEGAAMAEIKTQISGKMDDYNNGYFKFYITEKENVAIVESENVNINKYTGDRFHGDIVIRYCMLEDEKANYTGIAQTYRQYLIDNGVLKKQDSAEHAELFLEILGAAKESKNFIGIPYQGMKELTTFEEAKAMLEYLAAHGVSDMNVELTGWMNKGENHTALKKISVESVLGSKSKLDALAEYAQSQGYSFYPGMNLQKIYAANNIFSKRGTYSFAGKYGSSFLSNEYAQLGTHRLGVDHLRLNELSAYLISPSKLSAYTQSTLDKLSKYKLDGISVQDVGSLLVADYTEKAPVSRVNAAKAENEAMALISEKCDLMLSSAYSYIWQYADKLSDLPTRSNEFNVFSYDIPLLQLVLDGCMTTSTAPLNNDTQKDNTEMLLKCIETRTNPKFCLMQEKMTKLSYTEMYFDLLSADFDEWKDRVADVYQTYDAFYQKVKGAEIVSHETLAKNVVKVTYNNGVVVYVNHTRTPYKADGVTVPALEYLIENK